MSLAWLVPTRSLAQPNEGRRLVQRARGLALGGQCDLAIPVYDRAIELAPSSPDLRRERGACHEQLGQREAAAADYRAYCTAAPTAADVPVLRQRIADLEAPGAARPQAAPVAPAVAPAVAPSASGLDLAAAIAANTAQGPPSPPVHRVRREEVAEDDVRFRGGVSAAAGGIFVSGYTGFLGGADGRLGVQINNLLGVYVQPHLVFGPVSVSAGGISASTLIGVLSATGMVDLTLLDSLFVAAGGGFGIVNSPYGPVVQFRAGGYPVVEHGESGGRRKGLMLGADVRVYLLNGFTFVEATAAIGYEAF